MPIYVYDCPSCKERYEATQSITEKPHESCTLCGKATPERVITATSFVLKGGGWYKDGYGTSKGKE